MKGSKAILIKILQTVLAWGILTTYGAVGAYGAVTDVDNASGTTTINTAEEQSSQSSGQQPAQSTTSDPSLTESQPVTQGVAGFSDVTQEQDLESQNREQQYEEDANEMPEWTQPLVTGRGESESGFSGARQDMSKVDPDYEGELDPVSGQPITVSKGQTVALAGRVRLSETMEYDVDTSSFVFTSARYATEVSANVADGMITREPVVILVPEGVSSFLYMDGNQVEQPDYNNISEPGAYVFRLGGGTETDDLFSFTIVSETTGAVSYYDLPEGFQVSSVNLDGTDVTDARTRVNLLEEGEYQIVYDCTKANLSYSLILNIDHTAPELVFEGVDERGIARGPVTFSGLGKGESVTATRDGREFNLRGDTLTGTGEYELTATDQAGNTSIYEVTILLYLNAQSVVFLALFVAVVAAVIIYLEYQRRRMRVR